ncbi:MAG TPA: AMP-binding protein [Chthoniobacterales bacterium]
MNFVQAFRERVDLQPGVPALIDHTLGGDRILNYAALNRLADALSIRLREAKIVAGDLFVLLLEPGQEFYLYLLAALQIGAVPVLYGPPWGSRQISRWLREVEPAACVLPQWQHAAFWLASGLRNVSKQLSVDSKGTRARWLRLGHIGTVEELDPSAPALIVLGSDHAGQPVAWRWTQGCLNRSLDLLATALRLKAGDMDLCRTPLHLLANLRAGLTSLVPINSGLLAKVQLHRQIEKFKPTRTAASALDLAFLLRKESSTLHRIYVLNGPPAERERNLLLEHGSRITVDVLFGDAMPIAVNSLNASVVEKNACCLGRLLEFVEARILRVEKGKEGWWPSGKGGEAGELTVRADFLPVPCSPYGEADPQRIWKDSADPDATWLRTGRHGFFDDTQRFWLTRA